jgi:hypothetical protein
MGIVRKMHIKFPPRSIWFDRLSLYRYVAVLLFPSFVFSLYRAFTEEYPITWRVPLFWFAVVLYYSAIGRDLWLTLRLRRQIRKSMTEIVNRDETSQ